ncbi:UDP-glucuronosyl/UDP-glucosyltransferase family-containing protein [Strongyloides ratti]|uniref:glucuronosyltransferase n=1 Tax=Strongyloides ratti TaxID=34506 RepID=A0A090LV79_STRRB|nr:UDP-glucuronosyl/UDP-glucosyltransferase family-containing protein [Strongyloides ratti]CEF71569.1 UDP-glucuronosyl/UDP-glucosyltransferase family-containing protein [Strongyloides ratti]
MINIADFLAENGHNVTIIHAPMNPKTIDNQGKKATVVRPSTYDKKIKDIFDIADKNLKEIWNIDSLWNPYYTLTFISIYNKWLAASCEHIIKEDNLTELIRNEKFDLGIGEAFVPCVFGMFKYYNITKHVAVMSGIPYDTHYNEMGINFPIGQVPSIFAPISENMSFMERLYNTFFYLTSKYLHREGVYLGNDIFNKHAPTYNINLENIFNECIFYISNTDPIINYGVPGSPKMIQLGGFLLKQPSPLNSYFDNLLNKRKKNVIISFGSFAKSINMPKEGLNTLIELFKSFPNVTFIFKYEEENSLFLKNFDNVITTKWLPQYNLLNDKRVSVFIMHGGMNSLLESSRAGVPMLGIPLFYDQPRNAKIIGELKLGRWIDKFQFIKDKNLFINTFRDVLENPLYKKSIKKISEMIRKKPYNEKELFLKYIEFACQFGEIRNFNIGSKKKLLYQYSMIDIYLFIIFSFYGSIYWVYLFLKYIWFFLVHIYYSMYNKYESYKKNKSKEKKQ